jgi:hypothetical protein
MRYCGKIYQSRRCHRQYGACAFHAGYLRLQTHTFVILKTHCFSTAITVTRTLLSVKVKRTLPIVLHMIVVYCKFNLVTHHPKDDWLSLGYVYIHRRQVYCQIPPSCS